MSYSVVCHHILLSVVPISWDVMCTGRMSDQDTAVRLTATHTFAALIQLMPLDGGAGGRPPPAMPPALTERREQDRLFLEQLFNPRTIPDYKVPVPIRASLRSYQQVLNHNTLRKQTSSLQKRLDRHSFIYLKMLRIRGDSIPNFTS